VEELPQGALVGTDLNTVAPCHSVGHGVSGGPGSGNGARHGERV